MTEATAAGPDATRPDVHLVGSVPLPCSEDVLRTGGEILGLHVAGLPDGEMGDRSAWVHFVAYHTFYRNLAFRVAQRPGPKDGHISWYAASLEDQWSFEVIDPEAEIELGPLGYAAAARDSESLMPRLKQEGIVPPKTRFQVTIPFPDGAVQPFFRGSDDFELVAAAYRDAVRRDVAELVATIPPERLLLQWDVCWEVLNLEGATPWAPASDHWARYVATVEELSRDVPEEVLMGFHFCYGNWEARHVVEPADLGLCVRMAKAAIEHAGRRVDYVHMPVPRERDDSAYFEPLNGLNIGDTRLFLGLVHLGDGIDGARARVQAARRYRDDFGVATECGLGYHTAEEIPTLFELHRDVAEQLLGEPAAVTPSGS
jgi:hypothetical protein